MPRITFGATAYFCWLALVCGRGCAFEGQFLTESTGPKHLGPFIARPRSRTRAGLTTGLFTIGQGVSPKRVRSVNKIEWFFRFFPSSQIEKNPKNMKQQTVTFRGVFRGPYKNCNPNKNLANPNKRLPRKPGSQVLPPGATSFACSRRASGPLHGQPWPQNLPLPAPSREI